MHASHFTSSLCTVWTEYTEYTVHYIVIFAVFMLSIITDYLKMQTDELGGETGRVFNFHLYVLESEFRKPQISQSFLQSSHWVIGYRSIILPIHHRYILSSGAVNLTHWSLKPHKAIVLEKHIFQFNNFFLILKIFWRYILGLYRQTVDVNNYWYLKKIVFVEHCLTTQHLLSKTTLAKERKILP